MPLPDRHRVAAAVTACLPLATPDLHRRTRAAATGRVDQDLADRAVPVPAVPAPADPVATAQAAQDRVVPETTDPAAQDRVVPA
ncbi:MAG TPA: hypothetical protein VE400_10530, partial [Mycobacterium sp.]|nr:hypothetical protein [Mycobacterium sp.]